MTRTLLLRLFGLLVAAAFGVAATSYLLYGFEAGEGWGDALASVADWMRRRPLVGAAVSAGVALLLFALVSLWIIVRRPAAVERRVNRGRSGRTTVDLPSLAASLRRSLRAAVHPEIDVVADGPRIEAIVPVRSLAQPLELAEEVAAVLPREVERRGVKGIRLTVVTGDRKTKRRVR